jgi:hypothetical protein
LWRELWTFGEKAGIVIWQDDCKEKIIDFCGDEMVVRSIRLVDADWVQDAIAFGKHMGNKAPSSDLEQWFSGANPLWTDLLDAARIDFIPGPVFLTDPNLRLIKLQEDNLSPEERKVIRLSRQRAAFDARGAARREGQWRLIELIKKFYHPEDPAATVTSEQWRCLPESLEKIRLYFLKGFHSWRDYRNVN